MVKYRVFTGKIFRLSGNLLMTLLMTTLRTRWNSQYLMEMAICSKCLKALCCAELTEVKHTNALCGNSNPCLITGWSGVRVPEGPPQAHTVLDTCQNRLLQAVLAILYSYYKIKFLRLLIHFECKRTPPKFCVPKT